MIFHRRRFRSCKLRDLLLSAIVCSALPALALAGTAPPQSDPDRVFADAVQDYTNNRFAAAQAKFGKVQGAHAQEAAKYLENIGTYNEAITTADDIMRDQDLDVPSAQSAIREYKAAIQIKPDGPLQAKEKLAKAEARLEALKQKPGITDPKILCEKSLNQASAHRYAEAAAFSCKLAFDHAGATCGEIEAKDLCSEQKRLAINAVQAAYTRNDFELAAALAQKISADMHPAAQVYLDKINRFRGFMGQAAQLSKSTQYEEARTAFENAANLKADGPGNPRAAALRMGLMEALDQFFSGDYVASEDLLEKYIEGGGEKLPLARFYLGASKLARFHITGETPRIYGR